MLREQSKPIAVELKRKAEVADTLKQSVVDITSLQVVGVTRNHGRPILARSAFSILTLTRPSCFFHTLGHRSVAYRNSQYLSKQQRPTSRPSWSSAYEPCPCKGRRQAGIAHPSSWFRRCSLYIAAAAVYTPSNESAITQALRCALSFGGLGRSAFTRWVSVSLCQVQWLAQQSQP